MRAQALAVGLIVLASAGSQATAAEVLCTHPGAADVTLALSSREGFGHKLSCIAGDFVEDMTPCAPDGGYGLSAPTGDARLVGVAMDWREPAYASHVNGGVMGWPRPGLNETWRFEVSRLTGEGALALPGRPPVLYACRAASQRF